MTTFFIISTHLDNLQHKW